MQQERVAESQEGPGRIGCSCTILTGTAEVFRNDTVLFHLLNNCWLPVSESCQNGKRGISLALFRSASGYLTCLQTKPRVVCCFRQSDTADNKAGRGTVHGP